MSSQNPKLVFVIAALFFTTVGIVAANTQGYVKQQDIDPQNYALQSRFVPHSEVLTLFFTKVILNRNRTEVVLPFKLPSTNQIIYLGYNSDVGINSNEVLVYHPQVTGLNWDLVESDNLRLYQKTHTFDTIDQFLSSNTPTSSIASDPPLITQYPQLEGSTSLSFIIDLDSIDYILTTYQPSKKVADTFLYEKVFDTSTASLNEQGEIQWFVRAPLATEENPYLLGNIQVEFVQ